MNKVGHGLMVDSGIIPSLPDRRELNDDSKAAIAGGERPSCIILARHGSNEAMVLSLLSGTVS